jgi:ubiquinol-cytochrome c reductase iron-sulfur subunit
VTRPDEVRRAERRVAAGLALTALAAAGFAAVYVLEGGVQLQGVTLATAFLALGYTLTVWSRHLTPQDDYVEQREPMPSAPQQRQGFVEALAVAPVSRSRLVRGMLVVALGSIGAALLFPLRSLYWRPTPPLAVLGSTPWRAGSLVVTEEGEPVRPEDLDIGTILTVYPAGHTEAADAPAVVLRVDPQKLQLPPERADWTVDGIVAYSKLCTHAGCPVGLYAQTLEQLFCPCHQSVFAVLEGAVPIAGPAARPLPQLPIAVGPGGALVARGDFSGPTGAGYWSLP